MRSSVVLATLALTASFAVAQPYYVRGEFNGWNNNTDAMTQVGPNAWAYTVTGLNPGQGYEFKATVDDWSTNAPGSNARHTADSNGELTVYLYDTTAHNDGWNPEGRWRLGYEDSGNFDWELIGEMNGWNAGAGWSLTDLGNGIHQADFALAAGTYQWKFRSIGDWGYSIGDDFGNAASNNSITLAQDALVRYTLDLPHGRWTTEIIPAPATLVLGAFAGIVAVRRRR